MMMMMVIVIFELSMLRQARRVESARPELGVLVRGREALGELSLLLLGLEVQVDAEAGQVLVVADRGGRGGARVERRHRVGGKRRRAWRGDGVGALLVRLECVLGAQTQLLGCQRRRVRPPRLELGHELPVDQKSLGHDGAAWLLGRCWCDVRELAGWGELGACCLRARERLSD